MEKWLKIQSYALLFFLSGCSLLFGNIKPIEEKSTRYSIQDLSIDQAHWKKVTQLNSNNSDSNESNPPDLALESRTTHSIISINSSCKPYREEERKPLKELTKPLLFGISELKIEDQKTITLQGVEAIETQASGKLNQNLVKLKTLTLFHSNCIYDLMLISQAHYFSKDEKDFSRFVSSFRLK